jgi:methionyl-tRNA synthetase
MVQRYRQGALSATGAPGDLAARAADCVARYRAHMDVLALESATAEVFRFTDAANEYIASRQPWTLAKNNDTAGLNAVLWNATEAVRLIAVLLSPVMPASCEEILNRVGATGAERTSLAFALKGARQVAQRDALWPRWENKEKTLSDQPTGSSDPSGATEPAAKPSETQAQPPAPADQWPMESRISIDDFLKIDLRVAKVLTAERVPKSKKLMKLTIDVGTEQRTLVAGIADGYEPEQLVGRHVAIVANLKPATLMGIESNGMVLAATATGGNPLLVTWDVPPPPGTRIK